jgi:hypothetical protein
MASQCRAKNPATCRNHGTGFPTSQTTSSSNEAEKKEFFGSSVWNKVTAMQEQSKTNGVVRDVIKKASQDIRGFDNETAHNSDKTRKYIVGILSNPELSEVKHEGDPSTAVFMIREKLDEYDTTIDDSASALATVRLFRALGREDEISPGLEAKAYSNAQKPAIGASFEAKAEAMVHVLNKQKVFGDTLDGRWLKSEMRGFEGMVRDQATGKDSHNSLELTYRGSNVRLLVDAKVIDREVTITGFKAYDHPSKNSRMDYEGLNNDLTAIFFDED